jgi:N-acetylglucosamine kinase-like BadF-type ATPase
VLARAARGERPDVLHVLLIDSMQLASVDELEQVLHWNSRSLPWGIHAQAVFQAADEGSDDARALVAANAQAVGTLVVRLSQRGVDVRHAVVGGDVAPEVPRLFAGIRHSILELLPGTDVRMLEVPAVEGAVRLALRAAG